MGARRAGVAVLSIAIALAAPAAAEAATFPVTKLADTLDGACNADCSLREAVQAANADSTADEIVLPAGVLRLERPGVEDANATGDLDVTQDLTIRGAGPTVSTLQSFVDDRVLDLLGAGTDLQVQGLTITGGRAVSPNDLGGGIRSGAAGELLLERVIVSGNLSQGAAAFGYGGGVYKSTGRLVVRDSAIVGNRATSFGFGGGIFLNTAGTSAELTNVTLSGNSALTNGGGIYSNQSIPVTMLHVTITGNEAGTGGGIAGDASEFRMRSSVVAGNTSINAGGQPNCTTPYAGASDGGNVGDPICGLTLSSDLPTLDAQLGPFGGAPIPVAEPLVGSPALDRAVGACPAADARGVSRPQGAACDAGAAERPVAGTPPPPPPDSTPPVGRALKLKPSSFAATRRGASIAGARPVPRGSTVTYRLSEAAKITFTVQRPVSGRRSGRRCVTGPRARKLTGRRCTVYRKVKGSFSHSGQAGANRFRFTGRMARRALAPRRYRLVGTPRDPAGNRGKTFASAFRIVRP